MSLAILLWSLSPFWCFASVFLCVCCDDSKFWTERLKFKLLCFQFSSCVKDKRWNHCGKWFAKLDFLSRCLLLIFQIYNVFCCFNYLFFFTKNYLSYELHSVTRFFLLFFCFVSLCVFVINSFAFLCYLNLNLKLSLFICILFCSWSFSRETVQCLIY